MHTRSSFTMLALVGISVLAAVAGSELARAQATQYPILDAVTNKVILKYQQSSCEQLWQKKSEPPSAEQQKLVTGTSVQFGGHDLREFALRVGRLTGEQIS